MKLNKGISAPLPISDPGGSRNYLTWHMDSEAEALLNL